MKYISTCVFIQVNKCLCCLVLFFTMGLAGVIAAPKQEIIDYYWRHAADSYATQDSARNGQSYSCLVSAYLRELTRGGRVKSNDSSVNRYFISGGKIDSIVYESGDKNLTVEVNISVPDIFDSTYIRTFFPNDTGAGDLAIGFDTDSASNPMPTGIVTIDRDSYAMRRLHLSYTQKSGFRRFGRTFHFLEHEGLVLPDTIIESAVIERLMVDEDYRLEIILADYKVTPKAPVEDR